VALRLGLTVRRVQVKGWCRVPRYCAQLYPGVVAGIPLPSPICLLEEDCLDTHTAEVLISMAAPMFVVTDDTKINTYAWLEAKLACRYAHTTKLKPEWILSRAKALAAVCEPRIYEIAERLDQEGRIDGDALHLRGLHDQA
jgi:hypothetical protein